ncbi:Uncharacterised protein [Mycobacteroides abscessus subsp. abscessus]|nr:Uncharacterised protein [Mycobacteroides abscessus subsp. abscessus]
MSQARVPPTTSTPLSRRTSKSTSHSQETSRPSAYSSLMVNPAGFFTSSSCRVLSPMRTDSPRPKAGVTSDRARSSAASSVRSPMIWRVRARAPAAL